MSALSSIALAEDQATQGGARMHLEPFLSETGPLLDTIHDTQFTDMDVNKNYLFMDTVSLLMDNQSPQEKYLMNKVDQYEKTQKRKQKSQQAFGGKMHRLGTDDQVKTQNYLNQIYFGGLYVGEQDQEMQMIIDTSSDWVVIEGQDCLSCNENRYDPNTSGWFSYVEEGYEYRNYGSFI